MLGLNIGSGQRPFGEGWINVDIQSAPDRRPQVLADWNSLPFPAGTFDVAVAHHVFEHVGCGEAQSAMREAWRVLRRGGSLIVCVPNMKALAERWLRGGIDDYIFFVNCYGAYMGSEADRHKWGFTFDWLYKDMMNAAPWTWVGKFDYRSVEGSSICKDWWILAVEATK